MQRSAVSLGRRIGENGSDGLGLDADFSYWQCYEDPVFGKLASGRVDLRKIGLWEAAFQKTWVSEVTVP